MIEAAAKGIMSISRVPGRNDKLAYLSKFKDVVGFRDILRFIYNPYIRTGIAKAKFKRASGYVTEGVIDFMDVIDHFTKNQTGTDADANFAKAFVNQYAIGSDAYLVAEGMVTKTLKIGITAKSLNKVFGEDFIPMIGIMKAENYDDFKHKVKGPFIATEKLDGARRILVKEDGLVTMYSRSGIPDDGLVDVLAESKYLPDNCVYDGELLAIGEFDNAIELRQATNAIANTKGVRTGLTFNIFDMIPIADFKRGVSTHSALNRKLMLSALFGDYSIECLAPTTHKHLIDEYKLNYDFKIIKVVPIEGIVNTEEDVLQLAEPIWRRGFEGLMLNTFGGKYDLVKDRSRDILKVKKVEEHVLQVIDLEEGKEGTENEGRLGSLILLYKGNRVGCGSGIENMAGGVRDKWWKNPELIVGKMVEIECFGESTNKQGGISLNCPIFKRVAGAVE